MIFEGEIFKLATGEVGGIFAMGVAVGVFSSWGFFKANILTKQEKITETLRAEMREQEKECRVEINRLNDKVDELMKELIHQANKPRSVFIKNATSDVEDDIMMGGK